VLLHYKTLSFIMKLFSTHTKHLVALLLLVSFFSTTAYTQCWRTVESGETHSLAIKTDGTLWAWGYNLSGQLGDGTTVTKNRPVQIGTATNWQKVSAGTWCTLAIKTDGTLWAWGTNDYGQLGNGIMNVTITTPIQIGTATDWQSISVGDEHTLAIKTNGTLWAWGSNEYGQLGDGIITVRDTPIQIGTANNWQSVSAGDDHTVAIKTDGTLWTWGANNWGQLGNSPNIWEHTPLQVGTATNWRSISAGYTFTTAIKTDGSLWTWGSNQYGQLGDGTNIMVSDVPARVGNGTDWQSVSAGYLQVVALKTNGELWAWGGNLYGELGDGTMITRNTPTRIGTGTNWQKVSAGTTHTTALKTDGSLWATGRNANGELGNGTNSESHVLTLITCTTSNVATENNNNTDTQINIYPNPSEGLLTITADNINFEKDNILITNTLGQIISRQQLSQKSTLIDLQNQASGLYFIKIYTEKGEITKRVVLQR
jgi:alpha-tubulin suppressor-like RCC1 family protein